MVCRFGQILVWPELNCYIIYVTMKNCLVVIAAEYTYVVRYIPVVTMIVRYTIIYLPTDAMAIRYVRNIS